jgi:uncharacterized protein YacL
VPVKLILRLILALIFGAVAIIFSELIPPLGNLNPFLLRTLVTLLAAGVGFLVFPDLAKLLTVRVISLFNIVVNRTASEVLNQLMRLPRQSHMPFGTPAPTVGGISLSRPLIMDTSALIDGRILEIAQTGFISGLVLIPNFILLEMQQVADSADNLKRARGRRGFEIVNDLKKTPGLKVEIWDKEAGGKAVDEKLLKLTKSLNGKVVTTDFNLNRMASAHNVTVLNVNDLANALKTAALPGEALETKVVHIGKDPKQGIGYLPDGTMIVVEDGAELIGQSIRIEVSRVLQGSAGRMIFGRKK